MSVETIIIAVLIVGIAGLVFRQFSGGRGGNTKTTPSIADENIALKTKCEGLDAQLKETKTALNNAQEERRDLDKKVVEAETQIKAFDAAQKQAKQEFENLANKILKETGADFKKQSTESLKNLLNPLDTQIKDFKTEITAFKAINKNMTSETSSLTKALTSNVKVQGNWGEITLERILESSGLEKEKEYFVQGVGMEIKSAEGGRQMPDVIVKLPENKDIIIDSKVSLTSYMGYVNAADEEERQQHIKDFLKSVEAHIKNLGDKNYQTAYGINSPDFVMLFMPMEAAYFLAMKEKESLLEMAWNKNISIVCPSTLSANLRTVASLWKLQKQNKNAEEIARLGGAVYDKVHGFLDSMLGVGKALDSAQTAHLDAVKKLSEGRGNVLSQTEKLKTLGAKTTKSLPDTRD